MLQACLGDFVVVGMTLPSCDRRVRVSVSPLQRGGELKGLSPSYSAAVSGEGAVDAAEDESVVGLYRHI